MIHTFDQDAWSGVTTVGDSFGREMFRGCTSLTMNDVFNLPQGLATVGAYFASGMFYGCTNSSFAMNDVLNLPSNITKTGTYFAYQMFYGCNGLSFTMGAAFNIPQNVTTVGANFAGQMFYSAGGDNFQINGVFRFPVFPSSIGSYLASYIGTYTLGNMASSTKVQYRSALSIINNNTTLPSSTRNAFTSGKFNDYSYVPTNWGGTGGSSFTRYAVSYNSEGGTRVYDEAVVIGGYAAKPDDPTRRGSEFAGWYTEAGDLYNLDTPVTQNVYLHAVWGAAQKRAVTIVGGIKNGTVTADEYSVASGDDVTLTVA